MNKSLTKTHFKMSKIAILASFLLVSTGCSMLPDALAFGDNKLTSDNKKVLSDERRQNENADKAVLLTKELESAVKEWETMKPSIKRLVNLESDLEYLLVQLDNANSTPLLELSESTILDDFDTATAVEVTSAAPIIDLNPTEQELRSLLPASGANTNKTQFRSTVATPISPQAQNVAMNKFSNSTEAPSIQKAPQQLLQANANKKFTSGTSNLNTSQLSSSSQGCDRAQSATKVSEGIAIHLASFKSQQLAEKTLAEFEQKYRDISCNKNPIIKEVSVKNIIYHSVRLGPYNSRSDAEKACRVVRSVQSYCAITDYDGVVL